MSDLGPLPMLIEFFQILFGSLLLPNTVSACLSKTQKMKFVI